MAGGNRWLILRQDLKHADRDRGNAVPGNPLIKGTFWLDDVKLTCSGALDH